MQIRHPNWVRLSPNGTNLWLFKNSFQYNLARRAKLYWKLILKSQRFVPFGANLYRFGVDSGGEVSSRFDCKYLGVLKVNVCFEKHRCEITRCSLLLWQKLFWVNWKMIVGLNLIPDYAIYAFIVGNLMTHWIFIFYF